MRTVHIFEITIPSNRRLWAYCLQKAHGFGTERTLYFEPGGADLVVHTTVGQPQQWDLIATHQVRSNDLEKFEANARPTLELEPADG